VVMMADACSSTILVLVLVVLVCSASSLGPNSKTSLPADEPTFSGGRM